MGKSRSALSRKGESKGVEMEIKGGCLCGAVRYTAEADPTSATVYHRRHCQKFTGCAFCRAGPGDPGRGDYRGHTQNV